MRTSCRFAMAVHVLAVLAYKEGDRVTPMTEERRKALESGDAAS